MRVFSEPGELCGFYGVSNTRPFIVGLEDKKGFIFNHLKPLHADHYFQFVFVCFFLSVGVEVPPLSRHL